MVDIKRQDAVRGGITKEEFVNTTKKKLLEVLSRQSIGENIILKLVELCLIFGVK